MLHDNWYRSANIFFSPLAAAAAMLDQYRWAAYIFRAQSFKFSERKKSLCLTKLKSKKIHHVSLTELSIGKKVHNFTHFGPPKILDTKFNVMFFNLRGNKFPFNLIPSHHRIYTYIDVLHDGKIVRSLLLQLIYLRSSSTMGLHLRAVAGRIGFLFAGHCSKAIRWADKWFKLWTGLNS